MSDNIENLYPLSPLQQGMLFHVLQQQGEGLYFNQLSCELRGALNLPAFTEAWRRAVAAFSILRTAIVWEDVDEPLQVVLTEVELPFEQEDWRGTPAAEQEARFTAWLEADRHRGVELGTPPLLRLSLLRTGDAAYRFVFSHHHILLDGWSVPLLIKQVFVLYESLVRGLTPRVEQARPYGDYIEWIQERGLEESECFWRRSLAGFSEPTELGRGFPEASGPPVSGRGVRKMHLSAATTEALRGLARQHGLTLNTVVQGAWALLLGHHSGTRDVVFGTTVSGRPPELAGVEAMVGLFINTLPVRVRWSPEEPLVDWLRRLQAWLLEMRHHEHAPLVKVQRWSDVPAGTPLFESLVVFENYPVDAALTASLPSLEVRDVCMRELDHHPLTFITVPGREMRLELAHDAARFDAAHVERMLEQVRHLLESMVARPEQRLGELSCVDEAERRRLLREWSGVGRPGAGPATLHRLFEEQVARTPDAEALVFGSERLSYAELDARANQLAHHLLGLGVMGPESRVALCLERSPELIVAMLGVLKAGGAYVPMAPSWPAARLRSLLEDSGACGVLVHPAADAWLEGLVIPRIPLDTRAEPLALAPRTAPEVEVHPEQAAYVIYTSGSTGKPKGVLVEHRSVCNTLLASREACAVGPGKRMLQFASASFDASVFEIFLALLEGATLVMASREALMPGAELLRVLREERVTAAVLTPSVLEATPFEELPALESLVVAGEACHPKLPERWGVGRRFVNAYGPTEASICATFADCEPGAPVTPIGRPLAGARAYVLDESLLPVAVGVRGELYIGGAGVTRGYLGRPELTAERYVPDPYSEEPGARMYGTGDVVRWMPDGQLEYLGRADEQVKVRGFRIELGEIEAAVREEPLVGDAVVVVRKGARGDPSLVAYVAPISPLPLGEGRGEGATSPGLNPTELRASLSKRLPEYMVPTAIVVLEKLPLTVSGKVDRRALPEPGGSRAEGRTSLPPRDELERELVEVWEEVLGAKPVGVTDSFFELGGHSLLAVRLVARLRERLGRPVPLAALSEGPTVEGLAARLRAGTPASVQGNRVTLQPGGSGTPVFWVHPVGGNVLCYAELARHLSGRPFHALQATGLDGSEAPLTRVEDMASRYVEQVRAVHPEGPYLLGGWSLGGTVAYEMARELRRQGQEVALLVLLDSVAPSDQSTPEPDTATLLAGFAADLSRSAGREASLTSESLEGLSPEEQVHALWRHAREAGLLPPGTSVEALRALLEVARANFQAVAGYRPEPYRGRVVLLRARDGRSGAGVDATHGWGRLISSGLSVEDVPGDHHGVLRAPHVGELAERLTRWLAEVERAASGLGTRGTG